jgi:hypothetical protein
MHVLVLTNIDGLSIPFFNLGVNVSRTVSLSATLTSTRVYPDWLLGIRRNPTLPRQPDSENPILVAQEIETTKGSRPVTMHQETFCTREEVETGEVEPQPAASVGLSKPSPGVDPVAEIMEEVRADPRLPKAVHFPYPIQ